MACEIPAYNRIMASAVAAETDCETAPSPRSGAPDAPETALGGQLALFGMGDPLEGSDSDLADDHPQLRVQTCGTAGRGSAARNGRPRAGAGQPAEPPAASNGRPRTSTERSRAMRARRAEAARTAAEAQVAAMRKAAQKRAGPAASASARTIAWAEANLVCPDGLRAGRQIRLLPFQREFLAGVLDGDQMECALSIPRRNGKSTLLAVLLASGLLGPLNRKNWRATVASESGPKAVEVRRILLKVLEASGLADNVRVRQTPAPGCLEGMDGSEVSFLATTKSTGQAIGPDIALVDEAGGLDEKHEDLWSGMLTSISSQPRAKFVAIGTQRDGPLFADLLRSEDVFKVVFEANDQDDIQDEKVWCRCNPGLESAPGKRDGFKSYDYMRRRARGCIGSTARTNWFKANDLNVAGISAKADAIVAADVWARNCVVQPADLPPLVPPFYIGIDLGLSSSMCCFVIYSAVSGRLIVRGAFPGDPCLADRAKADAAGDAYERMLAEGSLRIYDGEKVTPIVVFLKDCIDGLGDAARHVARVGLDAFRINEAEAVFKRAGLAHLFHKVQKRWIGRTARADSTRDIGALQRAVLRGEIKIEPTWMIESAFRASKVVYDDQGNAHLNKRRANGRIDAAQATLFAVGLAEEFKDVDLARARAAQRFEVVDLGWN